MTSRFVRTLDQPSFDDACAALMRRVEASYAPTLMVGIRTGGLVVAQAMARAAVNTLAIQPLTCRRAADRCQGPALVPASLLPPCRDR